MKSDNPRRRYWHISPSRLTLTVSALMGTVLASCGGSQSESLEKHLSEQEGQAEALEKDADYLKYYSLSVKPGFDAACSSCHYAQPPGAKPSATVGPMSIYIVTDMLKWLDDPSADGSSLLKKVSGNLPHVGGNQCTINPNICAAISEWHKRLVNANKIAANRVAAAAGTSPADQQAGQSKTPEGGTGSGGGGPSAYKGFGDVNALSLLGRVIGFAVNPAAPTDTVDFAIFAGGDNLTGTQIARGAASLPGFDYDYPGDHRFEATIPTTYRNGKRQVISVYAVVNGSFILLNPNATVYFGYTPTDAGKAYYETNVMPLLNASCNGCHNGSINYETNFGWLMSPGKHEGATRANNKMLNKPGTANGTGHGGGNRCNNDINSGLCARIQQWWTIEFGSL